MATRTRRISLGLSAVLAAALIVAPLLVAATDRFVDVPGTNVHHDDITWLADAGVTLGCNPPGNTEYCPDSPVLRDQMASFMRRLAEGQVVDAGSVEGMTADDLQTVIAASSCGPNAAVTATSCGPNPDGSIPNETTVEILNFAVDLPSSGTAALSARAMPNTSGVTPVIVWVTVDATCATTLSPATLLTQAAGGLVLFAEAFGGGLTVPVDLAAGAHDIRMCAYYPDTDNAGDVLFASTTVVWSPGGSLQMQSAPAAGETPLELPDLP